MALVDALKHKRVFFDTAPFIYFIEQSTAYAPLLQPVFQEVGKGSISAITSTITLLEVLVQPYKLGNSELAKTYHDFLLYSEGLTTFELSSDAAIQAAKLRAKYGLRTPDALQLALAMLYGAENLLTNDRRLKQVSELPVLVLEDYL